MLTKVGADMVLSVHDLWRAVMYGLEKTWPATRTHIGSTAMGDVWVHGCVAAAPRSVDVLSLRCAVPCRAVLCCAVLFCAVLCCAVLC
jgi:hypothetical protein